jgi:hypothetical protein
LSRFTVLPLADPYSVNRPLGLTTGSTRASATAMQIIDVTSRLIGMVSHATDAPRDGMSCA